VIIDLKAVSVKSGDVLLLSGGQFTESFVRSIDAILKHRGYDCLVIYSRDGGDLNVLSDEEMRARGWQRVEVPDVEAEGEPI
jgi:hypothetical protein